MVVDKRDLKKNITLYTYIRLYWAGFGKTTIFRIIALLGLPIGTKYHNINLRSRVKLRSILRSFTKNLMDANTERAVQIRRLVKLRLIRGFRLRRSLPVRGQGTHTNAKTRRHRNVK